MSKTMKILVAVVVSVILLTVGFTATALAQSGAETKPQARDGAFISELAKILGVPEEDLVKAYEQTREQIRQERQQECLAECQEQFEERLAEAVEKGVITEDEAKQIQEWWTQRPEAANKLMPFGNMWKGEKSKQMFGKNNGRGKMGAGGWMRQFQNQNQLQTQSQPSA